MIPYIETHLVEHCNLKCEGCSHFSGLVKEPQFKNFEDFKKEMTRLSELTNQNLPIIRLMGGEPLLNKNVLDYCVLTRELFPKSKIVLVTNGILLNQQNDHFVQVINDNRITICVSNYHLQHQRDSINKFNLKEVHEKGQMYNISLDLEGRQNKEKSFKECPITRHSWFYFANGRLFHCCIMGNIDYFINYFNVDMPYDIDDVSIDIFTHTPEEVDKFMETAADACKYCAIWNQQGSYHNFRQSEGDIKEWTI